MMKAFHSAARHCIDAGLLVEAAQCCFNGEMWAEAAKLFSFEAQRTKEGTKQARYQEYAIRSFMKAGQYKDAAQCFVRLGERKKAIALLREKKQYVECLKLMDEDKTTGLHLSAMVKLVAAHHKRSGDERSMRKTVARLSTVEEQFTFFLRESGCLAEAVEVLKSDNQPERAAKLCSDRGEYRLAAECLEAAFTSSKSAQAQNRLKKEIATTHLHLAEETELSDKSMPAELKSLLSDKLEIARQTFDQKQEIEQVARVEIAQGRLEGDFVKIFGAAKVLATRSPCATADVLGDVVSETELAGEGETAAEVFRLLFSVARDLVRRGQNLVSRRPDAKVKTNVLSFFKLHESGSGALQTSPSNKRVRALMSSAGLRPVSNSRSAELLQIAAGADLFNAIGVWCLGRACLLYRMLRDRPSSEVSSVVSLDRAAQEALLELTFDSLRVLPLTTRGDSPEAKALRNFLKDTTKKAPPLLNSLCSSTILHSTSTRVARADSVSRFLANRSPFYQELRKSMEILLKDKHWRNAEVKARSRSLDIMVKLWHAHLIGPSSVPLEKKLVRLPFTRCHALKPWSW